MPATGQSRNIKADERLATLFRNPPPDARPWVFWFWINGNVTREGITADLEAMNRVGIGGALIMEVNRGAPAGPVQFMSAQWRDLVKYAVTEARRLGLEISMTNSGGWAGSGGPWIDAAHSMQKLVWTETIVEGPRQFEETLPTPETNLGYYQDIGVLAFPAAGPFRISDIAGKAFFERKENLVGDSRDVPLDSVIPRNAIMDLTGIFHDRTRLRWKVPPGKWTILRIGHTSTGAISPTATKAGLEADKLSRDAIRIHFEAMLRRIIGDVKPLAGVTLTATHIDSWEVGTQNWTEEMRREFKLRRGYDPLLFLPVITGRVVESLEISERFLWDLRQTISEVLAANYAGEMRRLAQAQRLRLSIEAYDGPIADLTYAARADEPTCELWISGDARYLCKEMSSAAHTNGKKIVAAEAFTAPGTERWLAHPAAIKALGDVRFVEGANRFVIHRYAMQPWLDLVPGMAVAQFGLHYERTQTWWEYSRPWHEYLTRSQFMLRQGQFVADVCYITPEGAPQGFQSYNKNGYDYDVCSPEVVMRMTVSGGRITLPEGMNYRVLVLRDDAPMTGQMLRKIAGLVKEGATVIGKPPHSSPSLADYPKGDVLFHRTAVEVWGPCDSKLVKQHAYGKGSVVCGMKPEETLAAAGIPPDFSSVWNSVRAIHRRVDDVDIYFVANVGEGFFTGIAGAVDALCTFRVAGKKPELWDPETGRIIPVRAYTIANGLTTFAIRFKPSGSTFVVFSPSKNLDVTRIESLTRDGKELVNQPSDDVEWPAVDLVDAEIHAPGTYVIRTADRRTQTLSIPTIPAPMPIGGPWDLHFPPGKGAPERLALPELSSWSTHSENGVKYFSGECIYTKTFRTTNEIRGSNTRVYLDLGNVQVVARVFLNSQDLGVLWKPPYRVDATAALKPGENVLEIRVANLLPNRMIGDELLPEDSLRDDAGWLKEWPTWLGKTNPSGRYTFTTWRLWKKDEPLADSGLIGPVTLRPVLTISQ